MTLTIGTQIGSHEITGLLGKGGMGEVYRARDLKLKREVAIKVLPDEFSFDTDRVARFQLEAEVLASLNHPNVAGIYDIQEAQGMRFLVLEFVDGETLADRIARGPLPVEEALAIAKQIAEALEAAHERGIIHRDLKPANVKITPDGKVKVLDFGLAKAIQSAPESATLSNSPTLLSGSMAGMIVGTASYMSPEQAKGRQVDKRTDIFAFGCVLYEMLTGKPAFEGDDVTQIIAHVLAREPDWTRLPAASSRVRELLRLCLEKNLKNRRSDATDLRLDIELALKEPVMKAAPLQATPRTHERLWMSLAAMLLVGMVAVSMIHFREQPPAVPVLRYAIAAPENSTVQSFAISPNGRDVVIATSISGKQQLWLRPLDALQAQPMASTEGAVYPFWSPDSRYIGFFAQGKLKKVAANGGPSQSLCNIPGSIGLGGSWGRDDVIIFSQNTAENSIQKVSATGGTPSDVSKTKGDQRHPVFLPDGRRFLYLVPRSGQESGIYVSSLDGTENRRILPDVSGVVFAPALNGGQVGHILFVRENTLMALPFDAGNAQPAGEAFKVADKVGLTNYGFYLPATVSDTGVLLYLSGGVSNGASQIAWYDRNGKLLGEVGTLGFVNRPAISSDEKSVVFMRANGAASDLWLRDLTRGTETRLTTDASTNGTPFWSSKSDRVAFASTRNGVFNLFIKAATGSAPDESLLTNDNPKVLSQWSRDGRFIVYSEVNPKTKNDIWVLPMEGSEKNRSPVPFLQTQFSEFMGQLSPDDQWMAYTSDQSGQREVYVRPFPPAEGQWTISVAGGQSPRWRGDGKELFFEAADGKMMAVPVKGSGGPKPAFEAGTPVALFDARMVHNANDTTFEYDLTADGKRFLINTTGRASASSPPLTVVVNWNAESKK